MAAPTDVRVEAISITSVILRWAAASAVPLAVFRSTDGVAFVEITGTPDVARLIPGTLSFTDINLAPSTKYYYKLSADSGGTFSAVVSVTTHTCPVSAYGNLDTVLPRAPGGTVTPEVFDDLAARVETSLIHYVDPDGRTCVACISDGALVVDCVDFGLCEVVEVVVTENVNSVSLPNCENSIVDIDLIFPPNTTRGVCGWPAGAGFGGDECFRAPIVSGPTGRRMSVSTRQGATKKQTATKKGIARGGGGAGGSGCECVTDATGSLTIKSCTADNSLGCSVMPVPRLMLKACGGKPPYNWSHTGGVKFQTDTANRSTDTDTKLNTNSVVVLPPVNTGSAVAGVAYSSIKVLTYCFGGGCLPTMPSGCVGKTNALAWSDFGCDDVAIGGVSSSDLILGSEAGCANGFANSAPCLSGSCPDVGTTLCPGVPSFANFIPIIALGSIKSGKICDKRSAGMVANGCKPCGMSAGDTVSVTDSMGVTATIVLKA